MQALETRLEVARGRTRLSVLAQLADALRDDRADRSAQYAREALELLKLHPDSALETELRLDLSWAFSRQGDTTAALEQARLARGLALTAGNEAAAALAEYHVSLASWYRSELQEARAASERARRTLERLGDDAALATTLTLIGAIQRSSSEYDDTLDIHLQALAFAERLGGPLAVARSQNNIGLIHWGLNDHERAYDYLLPVLEAYRE